MQWIWVFLIIGILFTKKILGILLIGPLIILLIASHWRAYEKLNYPKLTRVAKMVFLVCWEVSELSKRPVYK